MPYGNDWERVVEILRGLDTEAHITEEFRAQNNFTYEDIIDDVNSFMQACLQMPEHTADQVANDLTNNDVPTILAVRRIYGLPPLS